MDALGGVTFGVQQHLDSTPRNKFYVGNIAEEDEKTHAKHIPTGYPDVYINEDVTVTVDPVRVGDQFWIMNKGYRHAQAQARGALKDHAGVMRVQHLIDMHESAPDNFKPTSTHIDALDKFTPKCVRNSTRGTVISKNPGKLPPISKMLYENALLDKPDWVIDAEMWHFLDRDDRRFDCTGPCR